MSSRSKDEASKHATFSFGPGDHARIDELRIRMGQKGHLLNRSEVVRLALLSLESLGDVEIDDIIERLRRLRPGRTSRSKTERR